MEIAICLMTAATGGAIGYVAGSLRTFAACGYWCESLGEVSRTLRPWCGDRRAR